MDRQEATELSSIKRSAAERPTAERPLETPCLQVFLYVAIDGLVQDAVEILKTSFHERPLFCVVPTLGLKKTVLKQFEAVEGSSGFIKIDTEETLLNELLEKHFPAQGWQLYTEATLSLVLHELMLAKNEVLVSFISQEASLDDPLFMHSLANTLACELLELAKDQTHFSMPLFDILKSKRPELLFPLQAYGLLDDFKDRWLWIGFPTLSHSLLCLFAKSQSMAFCLVPTAAYLGDVISAKERLKLLKKNKLHLKSNLVQETLIATEHPLLSPFAKEYQSFYNHLMALDIRLDIVEWEVEGESTLGALKTSLYEGLLEEKILQDESLSIMGSVSPYQECLRVFIQLQDLYKKQPGLSSQDILILTSSQGEYLPVLNAIGSLMTPEIQFQAGIEVDPLWTFIDLVLSTPSAGWSQDFFTGCFLHLKALNPSTNESFEKVEDLMSKAHLALMGLGDKGSRLSGVNLLFKLKQDSLRAFIFDLEPQEVPYDLNFMEGIASENTLININEQLDELIAFFTRVEGLEDKSFSISVWIIQILELAKLPPLSAMTSYVFIKKLMDVHQTYRAFELELPFSLAKAWIGKMMPSSDQDAFSNLILVTGPDMIPFRSFERVFYLGLNPDKTPSEIGLLTDNITKASLLSFPLWMHQAKSGIHLSYLDRFPDPSINQAHKWIEALKECMDLSDGSLDSWIRTEVAPQVKEVLFSEAFRAHLEGVSLSEKESCQHDLSQLQRYIKDEEGFILKTVLKIKEPKPTEDRDIHEKNLIAWKLKQELKKPNLEYHEKVTALSLYRHLENEEDPVYLRSALCDKEETLRYGLVKGAVKVELQEGCTATLVGKTSASFEKKLGKQAGHLSNFIKLLFRC